MAYQRNWHKPPQRAVTIPLFGMSGDGNLLKPKRGMQCTMHACTQLARHNLLPSTGVKRGGQLLKGYFRESKLKKILLLFLCFIELGHF